MSSTHSDWIEVGRSRRGRRFTKRSSALAPTGNDHPSEICGSPSAYEIIAPADDDHPSETCVSPSAYEVLASSSSTASITKDASFSTASGKTEKKIAGRKKAEELRRLQMLKKEHEKTLREEG